MPKIIDYPARFDELRTAVHEEIRERGTRGLSLPRIAERMGVSLSTIKRLLRSSEVLPHLAVQAVQRRQQSRWLPLPASRVLELQPWERELRALVRRLPLDQDSRTDMLVWRAALGAAPHAEWAASVEAARVAELDRIVERLLEQLGVVDAAQHRLFRLVVDGVVEAVSTGRLPPDEARDFVEAHVAGLRAHPPAA